VARALQAHGFEVHPQVGIAGYWIDLGVVHPQRPGTYVLGVECDGASYHSARSARDRDRLRQRVLEGYGWNIHRIWSTDWFRDPAKQVEAVVAKIRRSVEVASA
jgi:very-short-patch-repair endonuclease